MENMNESIFSLTITRKLKDDFKTAGIWAMVCAIIAFVSALLGLFENISKGAFLTAFISAGISVMLNIILLNFGRKIKAAINDDNQEQVNDALNDLKLYFKISGILVIIVMVIALLAIIFAGLFAATR